MQSQLDCKTTFPSPVYGPVHSWQVGNSLGIDLLLQTSTCSFNCIYCQLGNIENKTKLRRLYVPTEQLEQALSTIDFSQIDIITFSGSGEPTLALNLGQAIRLVKSKTDKPVMVLTNGSLLFSKIVREHLQEVDIVAIKLDTAQEHVFQRMNRPVPGISLESIIQGAIQFRQEFQGKLCLQCMFMPANLVEAEAMIKIANDIQPDEIQLNTPRRPYPLEWHVESRGNHTALEYPSRKLATITKAETQRLEALIQSATQIPVISIYGSKGES